MSSEKNLSFSSEVAETLGVECAIILNQYNENLLEDITSLDSLIKSTKKNISFLDENNQKLRRILTDEVEFLESDGQRAKVLSAYELFRSMHQRRKVSDLVGLLQQNTD